MSNEEIKTQPSCADADETNTLGVNEALDRILSGLNVVQGVERLSVRNALGRTVAADIHSTINVPAHTNSAMDGYAVSFANLPQQGHSELKVVGTAWAGKPFRDTVNPGSCVRIMTGAVIPDGTDTVIMQEQVERSDDMIKIGTGHRVGQNIRKAGEDLAVGQVAIPLGKKITPAELGLLASLGIAELSVYRKLRVAFFSTGDELKSVGEHLTEGDVYDSNRYTLYGSLTRLGVEMIDMGVIRDDTKAIRQAFQTAADAADVVITSGGVSVGEADFIKEILQELGQVTFWKLAIKPGRPLAFGKLRDAFFFGLPGNPVAVMVTFYQFVQPALRHMMGQSEIRPARFQVPCITRLKKRPGRTEYQRGILSTDDSGRLVVSRTGAQGSGVLSSMSHANCFIVLPADRATVEPEDMVDVEPFEGIV
jgi:molybdopterin molybdotransferase